MTVRDVMTDRVQTLGGDATVADAAIVMRDADIGDVIVLGDDGQVRGIVTDRDIVVGCIADGGDPRVATLDSLCSDGVVAVAPDDDINVAITLIRDHAVRRLPVCEGPELVGVVSIGDLAERYDRGSALGTISAAPPNN